MTRTTGIRLNDAHFTKLDQLAQATGITSRNAMIAQLIENARVEERTVVERKAATVLPAKNNRNALVLTGQGEAVERV